MNISKCGSSLLMLIGVAGLLIGLIQLAQCEETDGTAESDSSDHGEPNDPSEPIDPTVLAEDAEQDRERKAKLLANLDPNSVLHQYGYLSDQQYEQSKGMHSAENVFEDEVIKFQKMMGLTQTGKIDNPTKLAMVMSRCGNRDIENAEYIDGQHGPENEEDSSKQGTRKKRATFLGSKWPSRPITYRINSYTNSGRATHVEVDKEVERAFKTWAAVAPLRFVRRKSGKADIEINFRKDNHDGCRDGFTSTTNVLAHAYAPGGPGLPGDVHFNDHYKWAANKKRGERILPVAIHEIGHSLGLGHTDIQQAIMYPTNGGHIVLHDDDKKGILHLYGKKRNMSPKQAAPNCEEGVTFIKGDNCRSFYLCQGGVAKRRFCPISLVWNDKDGVCDHPSNVPECRRSQNNEGGEGGNSEGNNSEGSNSEGSNNEGNNNEGSKSEGNTNSDGHSNPESGESAE